MGPTSYLVQNGAEIYTLRYMRYSHAPTYRARAGRGGRRKRRARRRVDRARRRVISEREGK